MGEASLGAGVPGGASPMGEGGGVVLDGQRKTPNSLLSADDGPGVSVLAVWNACPLVQWCIALET
jgi:hypothetical protein